MKICPNCKNANEYGDYEGPTCEVCMGDGFVADDWRDIGELLDVEEGFDAGEWTESAQPHSHDEPASPSQEADRG